MKPQKDISELCAGCDDPTLKANLHEYQNKEYCTRCYDEIIALNKDKKTTYEKPRENK